MEPQPVPDNQEKPEKPEPEAGPYEVTRRLERFLSHGDTWDASGGYGLGGQIGGLSDLPRLRAIRPVVGLLHAIPLGFCRTALNLGVSAGAVFPWGRGSLDDPSYPLQRFFMGGRVSPISSLGRPISVHGFLSRDLGPAEPKRVVRDNMNNDGSSDDSGVHRVAMDLGLSAFADLSFDLPLKVLKDAAFHGHVFASTGGLLKLKDSFRDAVGVGVILSTRLIRMEVNYCHIFKHLGHDQGKTGIEFSFSSRW